MGQGWKGNYLRTRTNSLKFRERKGGGMRERERERKKWREGVKKVGCSVKSVKS